MLIADHYQVDRRILHQAQTLGKNGHSIHILSLVPSAASPTITPINTRFVNTTPHYRGNRAASISWLKAQTIAIAKLLLPKLLQEYLLFQHLDPAHRLVRSTATLNLPSWDIVIAHDAPLLPLAFALRNRQGHGKIIFDAHELYDEQYDQLVSYSARRYWRQIQDRYVPACDGVITVTARIAAELQNRHLLTVKPTVLFNAYPLTAPHDDRQALHRLYGIAPTRPIVLCQGGLVPGRALEDLILAWVHLSLPRPALVFLGFGQDSYIRRLRALVERQRLAQDVFLGKAVPPDQVLHYTSSAALGLISNRGQGLNNTDGGPNRLFEYLQARVPVLAYEHRGVRDILEQAGVGWVVRWDSPAQLAEIVLRKLAAVDRIPPEQLAQAARRFCWENEAPKLLDLIERVAEPTPPKG